jgi:hypothetical protein
MKRSRTHEPKRITTRSVYSRITGNPEVIPRTACKVSFSVSSPHPVGRGREVTAIPVSRERPLVNGDFRLNSVPTGIML